MSTSLHCHHTSNREWLHCTGHDIALNTNQHNSFALKNIMEKRGFGPIKKVFFAPLVPTNSSNPRRSNKRKLYSEGWIEFESKKTARLAAESMNARPLGGPKGMYYRDDVINMRYL